MHDCKSAMFSNVYVFNKVLFLKINANVQFTQSGGLSIIQSTLNIGQIGLT